MQTRPAAVAGLFYEADGERLRRHVAQLLDAAPAHAGIRPRALIVPHAGYVYSGATAAHAYRCLGDGAPDIRRVLLIGPAHRVYVDGMALPTARAFATPLGEIPLDRDTLARLAALPGVVAADAPHRDEHSLEVQLPFLQAVLGDFELVPVVVGGAGAAQVAALIDAFGDDPDCLVVASSDLSHSHVYDEARRIDGDTCRRILNRATDLIGEQACGARGINGLMTSARAAALEVSLLHACNSGDTAGDRERVVGYASFALH